MMNTSQPHLNSLPDSDLELLSAYIDRRLDAPVLAELERRLNVEPRLRAELDDLRATAAMLRDLAPLRPPRSFTLNPATATRRRGILPLAWFMQLGGGLAGLALVLLASLQMLGGGGSMAAAPAPMPMQAMATAAPPVAADAPMAAALLPTATAAGTMAPMTAVMSAATAAPEASMPTASSDMARQAGVTSESTAAGAGAPYALGAAESAAVPTAAISASALSSPNGGSLELPAPPPVAKVAPPPPGLPPALILSLGIALLALALGSFLYSRR